MFRSAVTAVALLLTITACSSAPSSGGEDSTEEQTFNSVGELIDAAVDAGYKCPGRAVDRVGLTGLEKGRCGDDDVFLVFPSESDSRLAETAKGIRRDGDVSLIGVNWILVSPRARSVREDLGGKLTP